VNSEAKGISPTSANAPGRKRAAKPVEPVYRAIGVRCEMLRSALGWTQAELAKKVGYERTSIVNIEAGKQRLPVHQVEEIANAMGTTIKHFMRGIWV